MRKKVEINAIYEDDMKPFMKKIGLWDSFKGGELYCNCGDVLTDEKLAGFKKVNGKIVARCIFCLSD